MASLKDLIVMGPARFLDKLYGNLEGNASTATKLQTPRAINGTNFDGSGPITTSTWGTARIVTISDNDETNKQANNNINGGNNFTLKLPATIKATLTGNASSASKFYSTTENKTDYTSRFISFFDGSANGNKSSLHNSGLVYDYKAGTTTSTGEAYLRIGTNTNSTTANNMRGNILLYGSSSGFTQIIPLNNTEKNTTLRLPNPGDGAAGTLAWTVYNTATGSSSKPVYITSAGKAVAISNLALGSTTTNDDRSISTVRKSSADASYGRVTLHVSSAGDGALFNYTYVNTSGTTTDKYVKLSTSAFYSTVDNDLTLGTSSLRWKSVYGVNFYGNLNGVIKRSFVRETSNAMDLVDIYDSDGTTLHMMIGAHNTGNTTGALYLIPYPKTKDAWEGVEGLYISKNLLKLDNNRVPTTGNTTGTIGSTSTAVYVDAGVIKEISTLAISKGGTGTSTAPTQGGVIYASSTSTYASTAVGSSGQLLQSAGTGKPSWITATNSNTASTVVKRDSSGNFSAGTITANLTGTASKVNITSTNPSSGTTYRIPFMSSTGSQSLLSNDGIGYWTHEGTTSAVGTGELKLGNNIASGTAGNKRGMIYMYGQSSGYTEIIPSNNTTSNVQVYLPSSGGTIALTSSNITGNAATATKLATARTLTIGNSGKTFNGSGNVSWTLSEIGALAHIIKTGTLDLNTFTSTGYYTINSSTLTNHPEAGHGIMFVDYNVGTPVQFYMHDTSFTLYKRHRNNTTGGWNAWSSTLGNSISGNAATATKLATARNINGTSFDGSGNITTTNWGTARNLTIGKTSKSVNGSANVSWSLSEIGAMATDGSTYQVSLTGGDGNTSGYRLIGQSSIAAWNNRRLSFIVASRHAGNGLVTINYGCNNSTVSAGNDYCHIKYFGISESASGSPIATSSFTARVSADGATMYFFWYYNDYNSTYITVLGNSGAFIPSNGAWTLDPSTYGALIASTQVNVADSLASTLALNKGGTGATTKTGAKTNLGITYGTALPTSGMSEGDIFFKIG